MLSNEKILNIDKEIEFVNGIKYLKNLYRLSLWIFDSLILWTKKRIENPNWDTFRVVPSNQQKSTKRQNESNLIQNQTPSNNQNESGDDSK